MMYLGILLSIAIMGAVISMAFNKKSSFAVRIASLIALALMLLTIVICLVFALTDNKVAVDPSVLIVGAPVETKKTGNDNLLVLLLVIIFLIAFFVVIAVLAIKEHKKINAQKQGAVDNKSSIRDLL
jgi:NADH:ubiquinone oxidoreductase subunit 4 (subunit M)